MGQIKMSSLAWGIIAVMVIFILAFSVYTMILEPNIPQAPKVKSAIVSPTAAPTQSSNGLTSVNKPLKISLADLYNPSGTPAGTVTPYINGQTVPSESAITLTSGVATSAKAYESGTVLNLYYVNGNSKVWINNVVVPMVSTGDSFGTDNYLPYGTNPAPLNSFAIGTYTGALRAGTTTISGSGTYNQTASGTTPLFRYEVSNSAANTGLIESTDPTSTTAPNWQVELVVKISGTGAETVNLQNAGFDKTFFVGTTQYGLLHLNAASLSVWKSSSGTYMTKDGVQCIGDQVVSWSPTLTGYSSGSATMAITAYAYCDPNYVASNSGAIPSSAVQLATTSITLGV